jgi:hypothetical protein
MANHNQLVKEQLQHMLLGTSLFVCLASVAIALDLAGDAIVRIGGVSNFTYQAIEMTSHVLLVIDLFLFALYLYKSSTSLVKEIFS